MKSTLLEDLGIVRVGIEKGKQKTPVSSSHFRERGGTEDCITKIRYIFKFVEWMSRK